MMMMLLLMISAIFSQMDKKSIIYDKAYVQETFEMKYSENWNFRWNAHGTPHRVYGKNIPFSFDIQNTNLSEYYARKFIEDNHFLFEIDNSNLELWINELGGNIRYLTFNQMYNNIPVYNARIDFRFNEQGNLVLFGHDGYPNININPNYILSDEQALNFAKEHISFDDNIDNFVVG